MSDTDNLYRIVERLESQQENTNTKLGLLSDRIGELVTVLARKEVSDDNTMKVVEEVKALAKELEKRIEIIEKVQAGQIAERKILDYFIKPAAVIIVGVILGGAIYAFGMK